ncbi:MAG: LysR family transcriptional regulator [Clostridia bacterium]|nr:LysR family transcriptional regulator [Clostridia bacterium]
MNTRHAHLILTILREGSFTAAAKALHITQPTLSQTVRQIETQLGEAIFVRSHSTIQLTPAGELYATAARKFIQTETQLKEALSMLHGRAEGTLRIGVTLHRSSELLPQILADFLNAYPAVRLEICEAHSAALEQMLLHSELDMALLSSENHQPKLEYRQIASEEIVLLAGKRTALARRIPSGSTIGLREAERERFVLPTENSPRRRYLDELLSVCNFKPDAAVLCDSVETAKRACANSDLVMLCPFISLLCDAASMQKLAHYHLGTDAYFPPFYLAYPKEQPLAPYAETLFTQISNRFRAMTSYRI